MGKLEKGNWPALNTKGIVASVRRCLEKNDIEQLSKAAYEHINQHMGFIAHYDIQGFKSTYSDVADFAKKLLTSEYSRDINYNKRNSHRYNDDFFITKYGKVFCQSVTACNTAIVTLAEKHLPWLQMNRTKEKNQAEVAELNRLAKKHNFQLQKIA